MEALIPKSVGDLVSIAGRDPKAELEVKVLAGQIQTKDVADRIIKAIEDISTGSFTEEHRASFSYADGLRVSVTGPENIFKVCSSNSFRGVALGVERKRRYFDVNAQDKGNDVVDVPDMKLLFTLRHEEPLRRDFSGSPMDPANHVRILHRKSWKTADGILRIDFSMVKSKTKQHKTFSDILRQPPAYELEVEWVAKDTPIADVLKSFGRNIEPLVAAYQGSPFLLSDSDIQRYRMEFEQMKMRFVNPVTMDRGHLRADRPHNILQGYTVTNKADGERCMLAVMRDSRVVRITRPGSITWTGLTATKDVHIGDVLDGEYLADRNLYCIFDVYAYRGKNVQRLPLMTTDDDITKDPLKSRLGCAHLFVADLRKDFKAMVSKTPVRIETKMFLAGDNAAMEKAIQTILDTEFEYPTDGLIFTPRASPVAPVTDRKGDTWLRVYKWKPASQNSIDFLVRYAPGESYDTVLKQRVVKGTLYVSRNPGSDVVYPCETITGEYTPPTLPPDLQVIADTRDRVPSPFQPSIPKAPDANQILLPLNAKGVPVDNEGQRIEDNTIIECARDIDHGRWNVLRTRYDKTYQYRVLGQPNFGNDIGVAESIWTNIHNPVTDAMIRSVHSAPPDDTFEDDLYYRDSLEARDRVLRDVYSFHNKIKEQLYHSAVKPGDTLLELAVGRAGDLQKWRKTRPSMIVGFDLASGNLDSPRQGACVRYLKESAKSKLPPALFIVGDMTQPLLQQDNRYIRMLNKEEPAPTPYLEKFVGLTEFDVISCQFAIHYACETEETFRTFVGNLTRHGKGLFFGTCMDGQAVYSLLLGKSGHIFRSDTQVFGEVTKEYADGVGWTEEFGKAILVKLESFERPMKEYLVPFGKVTEILRENGYELVNTTMFSDYYAQQADYTFSQDHQNFSFLHRSFVFKRQERKVEEAVAEVEIPTAKIEEEEKKEEEKPKKKRVVKVKVAAEPLPEPVFFFSGNPALKENEAFSNMYEANIQIDGMTFPTVEHYFQWSKARMFGDADIQAKIMKTPSPKSVKAYGKKVKDFKKEEWEAKKDEIMKIALDAKFMQHPELAEKLKATGDRPLAEANPRDKYWGIGTSSDTSKASDPAKWPGKNVMGKLLTDLRTKLLV
jgi:ribA/ribD-fused uncharacterized protein